MSLSKETTSIVIGRKNQDGAVIRELEWNLEDSSSNLSLNEASWVTLG